MQSDVKVRCYNSESMMFIINGTQIDITIDCKKTCNLLPLVT